MQLQAMRQAIDISDAHRIIAEALPPLLASAMPTQGLMRSRLLTATTARPATACCQARSTNDATLEAYQGPCSRS
jgi:hypothetical protein